MFLTIRLIGNEFYSAEHVEDKTESWRFHFQNYIAFLLRFQVKVGHWGRMEGRRISLVPLQVALSWAWFFSLVVSKLSAAAFGTSSNIGTCLTLNSSPHLQLSYASDHPRFHDRSNVKLSDGRLWLITMVVHWHFNILSTDVQRYFNPYILSRLLKRLRSEENLSNGRWVTSICEIWVLYPWTDSKNGE